MDEPLHTYAGVPSYPALRLFAEQAVVLPACGISLMNPMVHTNLDTLDRAYLRRLFWKNAARDEHQPAVVLGRYRQAFVTGTGPFMVLTDQGLVQQHIPVGMPPAEFEQAVANLRHVLGEAVAVTEACVFACSPGLWVWGHWLIEILPRILLVERAWPGQFHFALPRDLVAPAVPDFYSAQVRASLQAYRIPMQRLKLIEPGLIYRFHALHDFSGMHGDGTACHPGILEMLRDVPGLPPARRRPGVTAVLRGAADKRAITNRAEIVRVLDEHGAGSMDPSAAPFLAQVLAVRDAEMIAGDMGSNLCGAIYAGAGAGIITMAPNRWDDGFLPGLLQQLDIYHADLRGHTTGTTDPEIMTLPYRMAPEALAEGLAAITQIVRSPPLRDTVRVGGRCVARRMGAVLLRVSFGAGGTANGYRCEGFSPPEGDCTWSIGPRSRVVLVGFAVPQEDCWLDIHGVGYSMNPALPETELTVEVNGVRLGTFDVSEWTRVQVLVERAVLARRPAIELVFYHPVCPPPNTLGASSDSRALGFCFFDISLRSRVP